MKHRHLPWLLAAMAVLATLRVALPPGQRGSVATVDAVVRPASLPAVAEPATASSAAFAGLSPASRPELDIPGNAFPVRVVNAPLPPSPPPALPPPPKEKPFVGPPEPPPPPPPPPAPPLQVIGTWDDSAAPGVFVSTPQGTVLARVGSVLLAEYQVSAINTQQVSIKHMQTPTEWQLPITRAPR